MTDNKITYKIEARTVNGATSKWIVWSNGAVRPAGEVEVDMWDRIAKLERDKGELLDYLNRTALATGKLVLTHTGKPPAEASAPAVWKSKPNHAAPTKSGFASQPNSTKVGSGNWEQRKKELRDRFRGKSATDAPAEQRSFGSRPTGGIAGPAGKLPG